MDFHVVLLFLLFALVLINFISTTIVLTDLQLEHFVCRLIFRDRQKKMVKEKENEKKEEMKNRFLGS